MKIHKNITNAISLDGKVAVISGAASGLGLGSAKKLAEAGANIALLDINLENGEIARQQVEAIGVKAIFVKCDVRSLEDCKNAVAKTIKSLGRIDILLNNAGVAVRKNAVNLEPEEWDLALNVSLKGQYLLSKFVIPEMKKVGGGSIINTGSGWSLRGGENAIAYCAMKGGTLNMTRAMCIDHGKDNIRVNTVCPGDVDTPMLQSECEQLGDEYDGDFKEKCAERPISRLGTPEDIGNAVLFLASNLSAWVSGAHLVVDGGGIA